MENESSNFSKYSKTGSLLASIGVLIMISSFIVFIFRDKNKTEKIDKIKSELVVKDSLASKLQNTIKHLKPEIKAVSWAVPTGRLSYPSPTTPLPEYQYFLSVKFAANLKGKIKKVDYFLDHPTFRQKHYYSTIEKDSFTVYYKGWGCLSIVKILIEQVNNKKDTIAFEMCNNLRLRSPLIATN